MVNVFNIVICLFDILSLFVSQYDVIVDSGTGNVMVLKGMSGRADVGLLSLFEHYKSCQVSGECL